MNDVQMIWYQYQFNIDDKENFELLRHMEEHNAMFMNPEAVQKIRNSRENRFEVSEEDFKEHIQNLFGREANLSENNIPIEEYFKKQEENGIKEYLGMDLDDINFIPIK